MHPFPTRTGDDGIRVPKDHPRIKVLGCLDELNSVIGLIMVQGNGPTAAAGACPKLALRSGSGLATPGVGRTKPEDVAYPEMSLNEENADLPPLREFILPGGGSAANLLLPGASPVSAYQAPLGNPGREERLNPQSLRYINGLSDLLFILARVLTKRDGGSGIFWQSATM